MQSIINRRLTQAQAAQQLKLSIRAGKSLTRAYVAVVLLDLPPSGAGDTARLPFLSGNFAQVDGQRWTVARERVKKPQSTKVDPDGRGWANWCKLMEIDGFPMIGLKDVLRAAR